MSAFSLAGNQTPTANEKTVSLLASVDSTGFQWKFVVSRLLKIPLKSSGIHRSRGLCDFSIGFASVVIIFYKRNTAAMMQRVRVFFRSFPKFSFKIDLLVSRCKEIIPRLFMQAHCTMHFFPEASRYLSLLPNFVEVPETRSSRIIPFEDSEEEDRKIMVR